jgi:lytic cellulose monooxygenase (C1-hydroxylating)
MSLKHSGILINIYESLTAYTIPGPTPYATQSPAVANTPWPTTATWNTAQQPSTVPTVMPTGAGGAPAPSSAPHSTVSSPTSAPASSTPAKTSSAPAGTGSPVAKYGQCGGTGWTGSTSCASGSTCTVVNSYYYQVRDYMIICMTRSLTPMDSACERVMTTKHRTRHVHYS